MNGGSGYWVGDRAVNAGVKSSRSVSSKLLELLYQRETSLLRGALVVGGRPCSQWLRIFVVRVSLKMDVGRWISESGDVHLEAEVDISAFRGGGW